MNENTAKVLLELEVSTELAMQLKRFMNESISSGFYLDKPNGGVRLLYLDDYFSIGSPYCRIKQIKAPVTKYEVIYEVEE